MLRFVFVNDARFADALTVEPKFDSHFKQTFFQSLITEKSFFDLWIAPLQNINCVLNCGYSNKYPGFKIMIEFGSATAFQPTLKV